MFGIKFIKVQPTTYLLQYRGGKVVREGLGLSIGSLIAFIAGIACIAAAVATGFVYTAATVLDWQAVQIWRVEWLLAAVAALVAGILLKKADAR